MRLPASTGDVRAIAMAVAVGLAGLLAGCPDKKPKGPTCDSDADCRDGLRCVDRHCQACGGDGHCKPYEHCDKGACLLDDGACRTTADCKDGGACKNNKCSPCRSDGECGADRRCQDGRCLTRGACQKDEDCADDEDCVDGRCSREGRDGAAGPCQLEPVFFGFDTSQIDPEARVTLERDAACVQKGKARGVMLVGHTDPRGTEEYNIALSESRAQSVGDFLSRLGVDPARFRVVPKGETEATGADESGWGQDRRVELEWQ
jgi:peptidoglycan-associated lipoprotein